MPVKALYLCGLLLLASAAAAGAREFHVAPTGDDAHPGTKDRPFRTLARARDAVRRVDQAMDTDVVVYLHDGTHAIGKTVVFGPRDSGRNGHKVIYAALPGASPIITGGVRVVGWQPHDGKANVYRARVACGPFRQLYVDDKPAIRARTPNRASATDRGPRWPSYVIEKPKLRVDREHWRELAGVPEDKLAAVELVMVCHWYHQRVRIGGVADAGERVEITPARVEGKFNKTLRFYQNNRGMKNPFYFENALAFVDAPYEWYHDPDAGDLYLALPRGVTPDALRVVVPAVETLIELRGAADEPVRDIEFRGLTFEKTNWAAPSRQGVNMTQAAQSIGGEQPPGMIEARHTRGVAFRRNVIRHAGGHGLLLFDADGTDIEGNRFDEIAANGIDIDRGGGSNPSPDKQSVSVAVWNNHATRCGNHYSNGVFLLAGNVRGLIVEHNLVHDLPYSGMQIGQQPGKMQGVGCGDNRIRFNHVHHCTQVHGDGGGIYTLGGVQRGSVIEANFVHDIPQSKWDHYKVDHIYLDNFTSKIVVRDNVVPGGRVAERNGSAGNTLAGNAPSNPQVEQNAGIRPGYDPR